MEGTWCGGKTFLLQLTANENSKSYKSAMDRLASKDHSKKNPVPTLLKSMLVI